MTTQNNQGVVFRRIRGRVVPIKTGGKNTQSKQARRKKLRERAEAGGNLIVGGVATQIIGTAPQMAVFKSRDKNLWSVDHLTKANELAIKYSAEIKKIGFKVHAHQRDLTNLAAPRYIGVSPLGDEGIFAHELGHAQKSRQKGSLNYNFRRDQLNRARAVRKNRAIGKAVHYGKAFFTDPFTRLGAETEATIQGVKTLSKRYGMRKALGKSKLAFLGQSTYWAVAAGHAAILGGMGMIGSTIRVGKNENRK